MNGEDWLLVRASGPAPGHQRAVARIETRFQEQLRKSRMGLIGATVVQTHFRVARQLEFAVTTAMIDERHRAYFSVGIRHDSDGTARLDIAIPSPELGAVGVKLESGFIGGLGQRLTANRPCAAGADLTDVTELTPTVARGIFAPAGHIEAAPGAVASAGTRDHHAVRAVGQECDRGRSHVPRLSDIGATNRS